MTAIGITPFSAEQPNEVVREIGPTYIRSLPSTILARLSNAARLWCKLFQLAFQ